MAAVIRSSDSAATWTKIYADSACGANVTSVVVDSKRCLYIGTAAHGILCSTDEGANWKGVTPDNLNVIHCLAIDSSAGILAGGDSGLFRSNDGKNWKRIGLENIGVLSILVDSEGHIFVGTNGGGVFRSTNNGHQWRQINSGLTDFVINSFGMTPDGYLFVSAYGGGVYRSVRSTTSVEENVPAVPSSFSLSQNYPNPFNPLTSISYSIPKSTHVRLQVFNLLGQLISTLVDQYEQPGTYTATWDVSSRSSGLYFYRMTAGEFVQTKKATLLR
jgi:photosystem II stability/assembly factor-like uncharacterized protein